MNEYELKHIIDSIQQKQDSLREVILSSRLNEQTNSIVEQVNRTGWDTILGIIFGIFGIIATAIFFYLSQKYQGKLNSQVNRLADINRPFHKTFPEIMRTLKDMFEVAKSNPSKSELYIMNRTSAFGKIHTYNPKFIRQYDPKIPKIRINQKEILLQKYNKEELILNDLNDVMDKCKYLFIKDIEELYKLTQECSKKMNDDDFKIIVYDQESQNHLHEFFIDKYLKEVHTDEDIKNGKGLQYYSYSGQIIHSADNIENAKITSDVINNDLSNKDSVTNKIVEEVKDTHNAQIKCIEEGKNNNFSKDRWLKYSEDIPMQMYLLKTHRNGQDEYHTFIINAMSTKKDDNEDRYVDGIYSREQSLYSVFKTLFKETFKNKDAFKY